MRGFSCVKACQICADTASIRRRQRADGTVALADTKVGATKTRRSNRAIVVDKDILAALDYTGAHLHDHQPVLTSV